METNTTDRVQFMSAPCGMGLFAALIAKMSGERYDPQVVRAFNSAFTRGMILRHIAEEAS